MKKIVLLGTVLTFSAQAEDVAVSGKDAYAGFYAGLGICWSHSINKIKATYGSDGNWHGYEIHNKKGDKLGGSLVGGYGNFITGNCYLGGELILDIAGNKTTNGEYSYAGDVYSYYAKVKGFVPSIAMRVGGWLCPIDSLIYARLGIAFVKAEFQEKDPAYFNDTRKINKVAPIIGLGIEKNVYNNINVRLEGDYRFQVKKEDVSRMSNGNGYVNVENRLKGFTVRLMATYKF